MTNRHARFRAHSRPQRGVAAIEFGIVLTALIVFLYGIATFGFVFYTQQTLARAAEDGARSIFALSSTSQTDIENAVYASLLDSLIFPAGIDSSRNGRLVWLKQAPVSITIDRQTKITIKVSYPYAAYPAIPNMLPANSWVPSTLIGTAIIGNPT